MWLAQAAHDSEASNLEVSVWAQEGQYVDPYPGHPPTEIPRRYRPLFSLGGLKGIWVRD